MLLFIRFLLVGRKKKEGLLPNILQHIWPAFIIRYFLLNRSSRPLFIRADGGRPRPSAGTRPPTLNVSFPPNKNFSKISIEKWMILGKRRRKEID